MSRFVSVNEGISDIGLTFANLRAKGYVFGGSALYLLLGRHIVDLKMSVCGE